MHKRNQEKPPNNQNSKFWSLREITMPDNPGIIYIFFHCKSISPYLPQEEAIKLCSEFQQFVDVTSDIDNNFKNFIRAIQ